MVPCGKFRQRNNFDSYLWGTTHAERVHAMPALGRYCRKTVRGVGADSTSEDTIPRSPPGEQQRFSNCRRTELDCRIQDQVDGVEDERPVDTYSRFSAAFDEPPRIQRPRRRQSEIDAPVPNQLIRIGRRRVLAEVVRRADDCHRDVWADAHGDHVLRDLLAQANARIEAVRRRPRRDRSRRCSRP
jgi:hypothetical protein